MCWMNREAADARDDATKAHAEAQVEVTQIEAELRDCRVGHDTWDTGRLSQGYVRATRRLPQTQNHRAAGQQTSRCCGVRRHGARKLLWPGQGATDTGGAAESGRSPTVLLNALDESASTGWDERERNAAMATRLQKLTGASSAARPSTGSCCAASTSDVLECELGTPTSNRFTGSGATSDLGGGSQVTRGLACAAASAGSCRRRDAGTLRTYDDDPRTGAVQRPSTRCRR